MSSAPEVRKMARSQMRSLLVRQLQEQGGLCPLCELPIDLKVKGEGVWDHDHNTGQCRGVLHRSCNAALGKVDNAAGRWGSKSMEYSAILTWLRRMLAYYERPPLPWIYPMHKSPEEQKDARNAKARQRRAEAKAKVALRSRRKE